MLDLIPKKLSEEIRVALSVKDTTDALWLTGCDRRHLPALLSTMCGAIQPFQFLLFWWFFLIF
jgi:hypothetical protein